jgi:hypothetical protein
MHKPRVENIYTGLGFENPFICNVHIEQKSKIITLSISCHPIKFRFMLGQMVLVRVSFIEDLGVIVDQRIGFTKRHGR